MQEQLEFHPIQTKKVNTNSIHGNMRTLTLTVMFSILHDNADIEKAQKETRNIEAQICFT